MSMSIEKYFKGKAPKPIVVVGDVMLDKFVYGDVNRISPEAPIPVFKISHQNEMLGGAGNVLRNILSLETPASFISVVGDDDTGESISHLFADYGRMSVSLVKEAKRQSSIKTRYVAQSQQLLRADQETDDVISSATEKKVFDKVKSALGSASVLILSDYGKGLLTPALTSQIIKAARAKKVPVLVDPKGRDYSKYKGATWISPNLKELSDATNIKLDNEATIVKAARKLIDQLDVAAVLVTMGALGMTLVRATGKPVHLKAEAREVYDVSGAGDTVIATLAVALARGMDSESAIALANRAAGIVVGKHGTATVHLDELKMKETAATKVVSLSQALLYVKQWRHHGLSVGFTNGCFDLIHPGHIHSIADAKRQCDRLIVGLNADASIKRLKGESRPVQHEVARATVLGAMSDVDLIILFEEDTPLHLIEAIRPDVLCKGKDYTLDQVVGAKEVMAYGGRVHLIDIVKGQSTSNLIRKSKTQW